MLEILGIRLVAGSWAEWVGSIGTVLALLFAASTYLVNSIQGSKERKSAQAEAVTAWVVSNNGTDAIIGVLNESSKPIYEVIVCLVAFQGAGDPSGIGTPIDFKAFLSVAPPGKSYLALHGNTGMNFHPGAKVVFTDSDGISWSREGNGKLHKIRMRPVEYFKLHRPLGWELPSDTIPAPKLYPATPHPKTGKVA